MRVWVKESRAKLVFDGGRYGYGYGYGQGSVRACDCFNSINNNVESRWTWAMRARFTI